MEDLEVSVWKKEPHKHEWINLNPIYDSEGKVKHYVRCKNCGLIKEKENQKIRFQREKDQRKRFIKEG